MKAKYVWMLLALFFILLVDVAIYNTGAGMYVDTYRFYGDIWFIFYGIKIFVAFFFLAGLIKETQGKQIILVVVFFLVFLLTRSIIVSALFGISGFLIGYLVKYRKEKYVIALKIGFVALVLDIMWPTNLLTYPAMAVNRPTILRVILCLFSEFSFNFHTRMSVMSNGEMISKQVDYLFGVYPITVGIPEGLNMLRPELQVAYSILGFLCLYWLLRASLKYQVDANEGRVAVWAFISYGILFLPLLGLTNMLLVIIGVIFGLRAYRSDLTPLSIQNLSLRGALMTIAVCLALYQFCFLIAAMSGFGMVGEVYEEFLYGGAVLISLIFGMTLGRMEELKIKLVRT